jgi:hypothetical protein
MGAITGFAQGISTQQAFGTPVQRGRTTLLPVAKIAGGGGGTGSQGGYGGAAKPLGAFVLDDAGVRWRPAVDPAVIAVAAGVGFGVAALLLARCAHRHHCAKQNPGEQSSGREHGSGAGERPRRSSHRRRRRR